MTTTTTIAAVSLAVLLSAFQPFSPSALCASAPAQSDLPLWRNPAAPLDTRVTDLLSRLTLKEKISLIGADPLPIPRLGIPSYSHRNEALHGVVGGKSTDANAAGSAKDLPTTTFPQVIGMAATWDTALINEEATVISTEARARYNDYSAAHDGNIISRYGLNYYAPNINIVRDPRWGRAQETYGEDPFLTSQMANAFIHGLQGDDPRHIKIIACAKHFAVHSGPEKTRHHDNMTPPERDLYETYLPAFESAVRDAKVGSVMGAYSAINGTPCCANPWLLQTLLRDTWGFTGIVFSDGGAIWDLWGNHHYKPTPEQNVAAAVKAGCDIASGNVTPAQKKLEPDIGFRPNITRGWLGGGMDFNMLQTSVAKKLITESEIDRAVRNALTLRFRTGNFDPKDATPWSHLTQSDVDTPASRALALRVAEKSIVLLKNDGILPLDPAKYKRIAVIGPNADSLPTLLGNYAGRPSQSTTILQGIKQLAAPGTEVLHERGAPHTLLKDNTNAPTPAETAAALAAANSADLIIFAGGIDGKLECEESHDKNYNYEGFDTGDRTTIELPAVQQTLLKKLHATGKPIILVNCSGAAMAMPWAAKNIPAIIQAWYPGQDGGLALANVLFGKYNPAGRLPVTFYASTADLPAFTDYSMANRTYRYFTGKPLYAFGHGLSYTTFAYENPALNNNTFTPADTITLTFTLKNTGPRAGDEVPQVYYRHLNSPRPQARQTLCAFTRVAIDKNGQKQITLEIPASRLRTYDTTAKRYTIEPGDYELLLAAASDDIRATLPFRIK